MARLALVSRNPVMSMAVTSADHEVFEVRPQDLDDWLASGSDADVDALVLDLGSPKEALRVVGDLRAQFRWIPVLLVSSSEPGWDSQELLRLSGVDFLALPLSAKKLQVAAGHVLRHPRTPPPPVVDDMNDDPRAALLDPVQEVEVGTEPTLLAEPVPEPEPVPVPQPEPEPVPVPQPEPEPVPVPQPEPEPVPVPQPEPEPVPVPQPEPEPVPVPQPEPEPVPVPQPEPEPVPVPQPEPEPVPEPPKAARSGRKRHSGRKQAPSPGDAAPRLDPRLPPATAASTPAQSINDDVPCADPLELLLAEAEGLYTLEETASAIIDDAVTRSQADAAALLLPDGAIWRVAGGVSLRPLEYRLQLTEESWLVERIAGGGRGALIEDSDIARQNLRGAPLASWPYLMALPIPGVQGILLLARDHGEPFTETSLGVLAHLGAESAPLLGRAMAARALARLLSRHLDAE